MALSHKARKRIAIFLLVVWLPLYIVAALWLVSLFERPSIWVELGVYVGLGFLWALPFKKLFKGVGRAGPGEEEPPRKPRPGR
ncbi:DUF2842 domain-containing protein [Rhodovulum sp. DZ06]|uniref:DUF2842 domain-containing protein n=1 Tax=Rhodovulum sp. DZ06 TaxID=3425126 RepID=UPI003D326414